MEKENLILKSVRLDPEVMRRVEEMKKKHSYWKTNTIINGILYAVCKTMDEQSIYDMVRYWPTIHEIDQAVFRIQKKTI